MIFKFLLLALLILIVLIAVSRRVRKFVTSAVDGFLDAIDSGFDIDEDD